MSTLNIATISAENPLSISDAMALSEADRLTLLEAFLNGTLVTRGDNVIPKPIREGGTRGMLPRVAAAHDRLRVAFLKLAAKPGGVNTKILQAAAHQELFEGSPSWEYHYIATVADQLISEGLVTETRKGRTATWTLVA
jgi:hypothetical protein